MMSRNRMLPLEHLEILPVRCLSSLLPMSLLSEVSDSKLVGGSFSVLPVSS